MKKNKEEFFEKLVELMSEYGAGISATGKEMQDKPGNSSDEWLRQAVESNRDMVGRCFAARGKPQHGTFPEMKRYFKVVSERARDENMVTCLMFDEYPHYWFEYLVTGAGLVHAGDDYFGEFRFRPIWTGNVIATEMYLLDEISPDEYNVALHLLVERISGMPWTADHYRLGGVKPGDAGWNSSLKDSSADNHA